MQTAAISHIGMPHHGEMDLALSASITSASSSSASSHYHGPSGARSVLLKSQVTNSAAASCGGAIIATDNNNMMSATHMENPAGQIVRSCAGCGRRIADRYLLKALDSFWHTQCLKCNRCHVNLGEVGHSCFTKHGMILCKADYIKMFGTTGTCSGCAQQIPADELVMRTQTAVYHLKCFNCVQCNIQLHPGDKYSFVNGSLFCEHEFPKLFGSPTPHSALSSSAVVSSSSSSSTNARSRQKKTAAAAAVNAPTASSNANPTNYPLPVC